MLGFRDGLRHLLFPTLLVNFVIDKSPSGLLSSDLGFLGYHGLIKLLVIVVMMLIFMIGWFIFEMGRLVEMIGRDIFESLSFAPGRCSHPTSHFLFAYLVIR